MRPARCLSALCAPYFLFRRRNHLLEEGLFVRLDRPHCSTPRAFEETCVCHLIVTFVGFGLVLGVAPDLFSLLCLALYFGLALVLGLVLGFSSKLDLCRAFCLYSNHRLARKRGRRWHERWPG